MSPQDLELSSGDLTGSSQGWESDPQVSITNSQGFESDSQDLWQELWELSSALREQRHTDAATRDALIVQVCGGVALSLRQLSELLGRGPVHLRDLVASLVSSGELAYLYPDRSSHPKQRYIAHAPSSHTMATKKTSSL